jgi:hypothetical protein
MSPTTEEVLDKQIRDIGREIVALAGSNGEAVRRLLHELVIAQSARSATRPSGNRFSGKLKPIKAVLAYLDEKGGPATEDEIIDALLTGGFGGGGEEQRNVLFWSLRIHLNGTAKHKNIIRKIGALIGRGEWDDERFRDN